MSFLYNENVFYKLLADTGILQSLTKEAQNAEMQAIDIAKKMAQRLLISETMKGVNEGDTPLYVQDLSSLESFLNYLYKNQKRASDGNALVLQGGGINGAAPRDEVKDSYISWNGFWIHKQGILKYLGPLEIEANKPGNEIMKAMLGHLIKEIEQQLKIKYESVLHVPTTDDFDKDNKDQTKAKPKGGNPMVGIKYSPDSQEIEQTSDKGKGDKKQSMDSAIQSLTNVLPFPEDNRLSPFNMHAFITNIAKVVKDYPQLGDDHTNGEFVGTFNNDIIRNFEAWKSYLGGLSNGADAAHNMLSYVNSVPYNVHSGRPNSGLEQIFGSTMKAHPAATMLLQMCRLSEQALQSLQTSPGLSSRIGKDVLANQLKKAQLFIEKLSTF